METNMTRITISLQDQEKKALWKLALREFRDPHAQAVLIIRQELERQGLLIIEQDSKANNKVKQGEQNVTP